MREYLSKYTTKERPAQTTHPSESTLGNVTVITEISKQRMAVGVWEMLCYRQQIETRNRSKAKIKKIKTKWMQASVQIWPSVRNITAKLDRDSSYS